MKISDAARASGLTAKMIRYYEQVGLLTAPPRTEGGYRDYRDQDVHMMRFIRRGRELGFSLAQLQTLTSLWQDPQRPSAQVKQLAEAHLQELEDKIHNLQAMANTLRELADHCHGDQRPRCPILESLATETDTKAE